MKPSTDSLISLKEESQKILDFAVLVCYSVPGLKKLIRGYKKEIKHFEHFHEPDYFKEDYNIERLDSVSKNYKENLSKYLLISAFSFFESYFQDVFDELVEFHGGLDNFLKMAKRKRQNHLNLNDKNILLDKRKLQEPFKKIKWQKYRKYQKRLETHEEFRFPSELFSPFGLKSLIETVQGDGFKSVMIPEILEYGLGMSLNEKVNYHEELKNKDLKETFHLVRQWRNDIAHGDSGALGLGKTMDLIRFLRYMSVKIDKHMLNNFFILEDYTRAN